MTASRTPAQSARRLALPSPNSPNWRRGETGYRELRKKVTFAIFAEEDDMEKVAATVDALFTLIEKSFPK